MSRMNLKRKPPALILPSFSVPSSGDCKDEDGVEGRCVAGAINNYTSQLLAYRRSSPTECNVAARTRMRIAPILDNFQS